MTPTQMARRSDALYADGTCGMTRRVLCDMVAQRESDLEDARAENAKLHELCVKALEWLRWAGGITCPPEVPDEFADELRELGVEVDE